MPNWTQEQLDQFERKRKRHEHQPDPQVPHPQQRQCPAQLAADPAREAQGAGCPRVCFTLCRVKLLDVDAKYSSVKDLLDGLAISRLIPGDKEGQIRLEVWQIKVAHYKDEQTLIHITD